MISKSLKILVVLSGLFVASSAFAALKVVTTTTNLAALVEAVGGEHVEVYSLTKGNQDAHYMDAKPSFIMRAARADLVVSVGLELEIGWLPAMISGARNPKIMPGQEGSLVLGDHVKPLEIPKGAISRDQGDVHPDGNPHFMLDPVRAGKLALVVAKRLTALAPKDGAYFNKNAQAFKSRMDEGAKVWAAAIKKAGIKQIFTYHKTLSYFLQRMDVNAVGYIEPKPGVPPTASHVLSLIKSAKQKKVQLILVEHLYETAIPKRIQKEVNGMKVASVPVLVGAEPDVNSLYSLYESLVKSLQ